MSLFKIRSKTNAVQIIKDDHVRLKDLFDKFERAKGHKAQSRIAEEAIDLLKVHAVMEEELFYPAVRKEMEDPDGLMEEADEEHHVAKVLIAELDVMTGKESHWEGKFTVLSESVLHHIKEEEDDMLPKAEETDIDMEALGKRMQKLKKDLQRKGVPPDAEAKMVKKVGLRGDSPAKKAQKTIVVPLKQK